MTDFSVFRYRFWPDVFFICLFFLFLIPLGRSEDIDEVQVLMQLKSNLRNSTSPVFDSWRKGYSACNFSGIVCDSNFKVKEINLSSQNLSGSLPFEIICSLESLKKLSLDSNFLYGSISGRLLNCTGLEYLDLSGNFFSGNFPNFSSLTKLEVLKLNSSGFSGYFPWSSLENLTGLGFLSLGDNLFDKSPFPLELLKLEKLYWLYLTNCSIEGQIPEGIGNLTLLEDLELSYNYLSGNIPSGISRLTKLRQLELYSNGLTGRIPDGFGNLTNLAFFDASTNNLEGDISELRFLKNLESLQLFENQFSGEIPQEFGELKFLSEFSLYTNMFTGPLPQKLGSLSNLLYIDVSDNFLSGPIPPDMCSKGKFSELLIINNRFSGGIPDSYANCSSLTRLRVSNNSLSGEIPSGIWSLPQVTLFDFNLNQFEGPVAPSIGDANSLAQLCLANNRFSGQLPQRISEASSLVAINLSSNRFSGEIPATIGRLKKLSNLHLEFNLFSGDIPDSLGACVSLNDISLAGNSLSGGIPASLGGLPSLNFLNLSNNKLSGEIPGSFSSLRLNVLDLSNNRLFGHIPDSLSIDAFNSSFDGNPGLCSQILRNSRPCSSESGMSGSMKAMLYCFIAFSCFLIAALTGCIYLRFRHIDNQNCPVKRSDAWDMKLFHVLSFSEEQILKALKHENLVGKGGSGNVYKVVLQNGNHLAVKHIWNSGSKDRNSFRTSTAMLPKRDFQSKEYKAEVATLSSVRHVNVVKLYCSITSEDSNLLVYEFLPNGSLWDILHTCKRMKMDWIVRYEIALGAAKGLEYLHHGCDKPIIHRDVKSSNILLDANLRPKIADFGLAKILEASSDCPGRDSTYIIAGTPGYIAPEYAYASKVNEKSDVYSFGVVLMELVTGKKPVEPEFGDSKDIVSWTYSKLRNEDSPMELVDKSLSEALKEDAVKVLKVAIHCTTRVPALRPSMKMVVQMLENAEPCKLSSIVVSAEDCGSKNKKVMNRSASGTSGTGWQ